MARLTMPPAAIRRRTFLSLAPAVAAGAAGFPRALFASGAPVTVGVILPLSGAFADQGSHYEVGMRLFQEMNGTRAAGREVRLVIRDDQGPGSGDLARRLTQELILRERANIILGYSFTPNAMSAAGLLTEAKVPGIIVNAATSVLTQRSDYFTRISVTMSQVAHSLGTWAAGNGIKTVYTIVSDYAPGLDAEKWFVKGFTDGGGTILRSDRTPLAAMEYVPFLQRAIEAKPDAVFAFNPGGDVSIAFIKQAGERLKGTGIKLLVTGDVVDDNLLPAMGDAIQDVISAWHYQIDVDNAANRRFLAAFRAKFGANAVPSYRVVQGYDGMALIYQTLDKTGGRTEGDVFMAALKGARLDSPRGPVLIDPATREIVENIYIRRSAFANGVGVNTTFATIEAVRDPAK
ncbi:ABC transporter substrate-binding protein [Phreatobacter stygius]|nr:ABC transporter substrate-binding protein [Phreatobacter stygius]